MIVPTPVFRALPTKQRVAKTVASLFAGIAVLLSGFATSASAVTDRVMLVSWDGARREVVEELLHWQLLGDDPVACPAKRRPATMPVQCGAELTCLPNLCRFQLLTSWDSEGKPLTRPQHAQMLSGTGLRRPVLSAMPVPRRCLWD